MVVVTKNNLPGWLNACLRTALLGEIYPNIRAIAVRYDLAYITLRFYLDREVTEFDNESIDTVAFNLSCSVGSNFSGKMNVECEFTHEPLSNLDSLNEFVYVRREYDIEWEAASSTLA